MSDDPDLLEIIYQYLERVSYRLGHVEQPKPIHWDLDSHEPPPEIVRLLQQTGAAMFFGGLVGSFVGSKEGHKRAQAVIDEAKLPKNNVHGWKLYNNTLMQSVATKVVGTSLLFGIFVGAFASVRLYLDTQKRRRILNPLISGGIVGAILGCKNGFRTATWCSLAGMGMAGTLGVLETSVEVLTGRSFLVEHEEEEQATGDLSMAVEYFKDQERILSDLLGRDDTNTNTENKE